MYRFSCLDLFPYAILVVSCFVFHNYKFKKTNSATAIFVILLLFSSIRYGIGYDYFFYKSYVEEEAKWYVYARLEPFSQLMIKIGKIFSSSELYFFIYNVLTVGPIFYVVKKNSISPKTSLMIYLLYPSFFLESMGIIRNALAFALIFLSYHFLIRNKYYLYFTTCILAGLCHASGYIGLLLIVIKFLPNNRFFHFICIIISFILGNYISIIISNLGFLNNSALLGYLENAEKVGSMKYLILIIGIINFLLWDQINKQNKSTAFLLKIVNFGGCLFFLFIIDDTVSFRLSTYFIIFIILLMPYYSHCSNKIRISNNKMLFLLLLLFCYSFYLNIDGYKKGLTERMSFLPYQTIFYHENYTNYR